MVLGDPNEFLELLRGAIPYYVIIFLPILIILSPLEPVLGSHEFSVYRVQQYDLQGTTYGCRSSLMNVEARTLHSVVFTRRGVLARITELTAAKYRDIISQMAGGLIILLPEHLNAISAQEKQHILELERTILEEETSVPVYFAIETAEVRQIYKNVENSMNTDGMGSAAEAMMNSISANGFQLVVSASQPKVMSDVQIVNIWGKLPGYGLEEQLPSVVIVAHYDAFGVAPALSYGADSNGSGVVALLELARLFSRLYSSSQTHARYNLIFLLSGAGKFNYQGTKKWIEDSLEATEGGLLQDAAFTICLDAIGSGDELYLHVSKPPKEGSPGWILFQDLKSISKMLSPKIHFEMVHKKINLAEEVLAWEHERFSIRRLPAFTLSHLSSPKLLQRNTILDTRENVDVKQLTQNVKIFAEALARQIYNLSRHGETEVFTDSMKVREEFVAAWFDFITSQARGAQLFLENGRHPLLSALEKTMNDYLKEVKVTITRPDKRDPDFAFYDVHIATVSAYSVKPALFDLFLSLAIAVYLVVFYFALLNFSWLLYGLKKITGQTKVKQG